MVTAYPEHAALEAWSGVLARARAELPDTTLVMWFSDVRPAGLVDDVLTLAVPSPLVRERLQHNHLALIEEAVAASYGGPVKIEFEVEEGIRHPLDETPVADPTPAAPASHTPIGEPSEAVRRRAAAVSLGAPGLPFPNYTFEAFVPGPSNRFAHAAAMAVAEAPPSTAYNPLFIYGGVGLGKTHLMQAVGHAIKGRDPDARIAYIHSERFVSDMVIALQHNKMNEFKTAYRSLDALLIDDIQFFANKDRSQEEFFHTFNALLEGQQQVIVTADRYPKEVSGLEERLKSRFGWGLTVAIEPPELETCVAILIGKAQAANVQLPEEVAFFIAKRIRSNVRELEGALKRVIANSRFTGRPITLEFTKDALKDLLTLQAKLITIENIQKTVADYYKVRVADLLSKRRSRSIARPRQVAMALAKELTTHSLPEIGDAFGGRDHTTVLHACGRIRELRVAEQRVGEDYQNLLRTLTG